MKAAERFHRRLSRRASLGHALRGVLGAAAATAASRLSTMAHAASPPLFGGSRHQFTLLRPVRAVPPVSLTRIDGSVLKFASLRGKVVLVNFWATWCPACRTELPSLERLQVALGGAGFEVVAISVDQEGPAAVTPFLRKLNIRYLPVYTDAGGRSWSKDGDADAPFTLYGMPISYLVDPDGRIEGYLEGNADWSSEEAKDLILSTMRAPAR
ncbi:MAG: TlpA disulfide reductase family protein [Xanthobacteraceae bacterium]|nr:TlpA disulfide reductase family protein [Xanthobacteraceae bacterium]